MQSYYILFHNFMISWLKSFPFRKTVTVKLQLQYSSSQSQSLAFDTKKKGRKERQFNTAAVKKY